jgi:predicted metal-dependent HD superfamily phosphohydrolase
MNLNDLDLILFSIYYHDIIYNVSRKDNKEKSFELFEDRYKNILPGKIINNCKNQILATKNHFKSLDNDINYLIDLYISILGSNERIYKEYSKNIKKE